MLPILSCFFILVGAITKNVVLLSFGVGMITTWVIEVLRD